jgi:integrase
VETTEDARVWEWKRGPPLVEGVTRKTRESHRKWILWAKERALADPQPTTPIPEMLVRELLRMKERRGVSWSTLATYVGQIAGALTRLDQYCDAAPIQLGQASVWRDLSRMSQKMKRQQERLVKPAMTQEQMKEVARLLDPRDRVYFWLAWANGARMGNVLRLTKRNLDCDVGSNVLKVMWTDAKTTAKVGIYTTAAKLTPQQLRAITAVIGEAQMSDEEQVRCLARIRETLRRVSGPEFDLRSIRRGALSEMALAGTPLDTLMSISGHTHVRSLLAYIGHGSKAAARLADMARAT